MLANISVKILENHSVQSPIEQAESDRVSMYSQSHRTPREVRETAIGRLITGV